MSVSFSGLISGLDSTSIVKSLVSAAKASEQPLQTNQGNLRSQEQIVTALEGKLSALDDAAQALSLPSEGQVLSATLSDSAHVQVAVSGLAAAATHDVRVKQVAQAQVAESRGFASSAAGVLGDGSVTFQRAGQADVSVTWTASDSLSDIADRITQANAGVRASVLFDGTSYHLMVSATASGTAAAPTFVDGGDSLGLADPTAVTVPAKDAIAYIDGVKVTRSKNVIDDALPGVTFTLLSPHAVADADTTVQIGVDADATRAKVQKVVDAYNAVASALSGQLTYNGTTKPASSLFGDSSLQALQRTLGDLIVGPGHGTQLAAMGLTIDRDGQLQLDQTKFGAALAADPSAVSNLFATGGFASAIDNLVQTYTRAGDGILSAKKSGMDSRIKAYQDQIDAIDQRAQAMSDRLTAEFNQLETQLAKTKGTAAGLPTSSGSGSNG